MAKNIKNKTAKNSVSTKSGLKRPIKASKVENAKVGIRLAGNHNETLLQ